MELDYKFTEAELKGIQKRKEEVMKFLNFIIEVRELQGEYSLSPDGLGLIKEQRQ